MSFYSIRFKIVLWHTLILSMALLTFGVLLYHNFETKISNDADDILRSRAKGIEQSINTYWESERRDIAAGNSKVLFSKENNINFRRMARRWVGEKINDPDLINTVVCVFDARGNPIASSRNISIGELNKRVFGVVKRGENHWESTYLYVDQERSLFRVFTAPVIENKRLSYIVQVASPLSPLQAALRNLGLSLLFLLPLTVVFTGLSGLFLVQLTLRPVNQMIATIHQITAENLKLRLDIPRTKDEIEALAKTFNEMIARLDEAFTSQRQFIEDISHELKTPLSVLKGELEVTLKNIRSTEEYETILHSSLEEVNHLINIVENLLTLARFDTKTTALHAESLDLSALIKETLEAIQVLAVPKNITFQLDLAHSLDIVADKQQIKRMVLNILDNAIKYTPSQGKIVVHLRQQKNLVEIEIADTGIGIPKEELPHIFDRFYRVDKSRSSPGFGLGLSIAQSIATAHGGKIAVKPNVPQGTIFTISLPVKNSPSF
jgi:heavy metal sensor kinase